ncbi:MAG: hypothetical protein SPK83_03895, partial [Succinivibrio dextrinosolvens]|nr:hypothetical protein [Succinivibrio dextrinosolvens]
MIQDQKAVMKEGVISHIAEHWKNQGDGDGCSKVTENNICLKAIQSELRKTDKKISVLQQDLSLSNDAER